MDQRIVVIGQGDANCRRIRDVLRRRFRNVAIQVHGGAVAEPGDRKEILVVTDPLARQNPEVALDSVPEERIRRAEFLFEAIRVLSSSNPVPVALTQALERSTNVLGDTAFLVLANGEGFELEYTASRNPEQLRRSLISLINIRPQGLQAELRKFLRDGNPLFVPEVSEAQYSDEIILLAKQLQFRSIVAMPVKTDQKVFGVFISASSTSTLLTDADVELAREFSQVIGIALHKAEVLKELEEKANTDALTGLYNARFFNEVLTREVARVQRREVPLSLLMIDVDNFKRLNDTHGHVAGNEALKSLSTIFLQVVRMTDFVFRCGGDEFAIVLPGTDLAGALRAGEHIRSRVEASEFLSGKTPKGEITVSLGVSEYESGLGMEALISRADQALYAAKRLSRNCVQAYVENRSSVSIADGFQAM